MSVDAVVARVAQLQAMIHGQPVTTAVANTAVSTAGGKTDGSFANALQQAGGTQAAGAPTGNLTGTPSAYDADIKASAQRNGVDPALLKALIRAESGFNPKAGSPAGAQGLTQLMPATARGLGVSDPFDPKQSIEGGAKYLAQQLKAFGGDPQKALAAYNAGPGAVQKYGGVPPYAETQGYVKRVMEYAQQYGYSGASASAASVTPTLGASAASVTPTLGGAMPPIAPPNITGLGKTT